ncbi:hypothetical protein CBF23_002265 [Marinomonas agarivorans]|nr:hypothetical protein CBF23_002265 [Marinomonas agarivorans]
MQEFVPQFKSLDSKAKVKIRGSLASGVKLNPKKKSLEGKQFLFNPKDFDIDAYIVSERLFRGAKGKSKYDIRKGSLNGFRNPFVAQLTYQMRKKLEKITGNRDRGNQNNFFIVIRRPFNAKQSIKGDQNLAKEAGLDESHGNPLEID